MSEQHALWPFHKHDTSGTDERSPDVPPLLDVNASEAEVIAFLKSIMGDTVLS